MEDPERLLASRKGTVQMDTDGMLEYVLLDGISECMLYVVLDLIDVPNSQTLRKSTLID